MIYIKAIGIGLVGHFTCMMLVLGPLAGFGVCQWGYALTVSAAGAVGTATAVAIMCVVLRITLGPYRK